MNWNRLRLMRNAARIRRMHTLTNIRSQSVGEHTFGVIAILLEVADIDWRESDALQSVVDLMTAAMYHDAPEALTGDVPSPAKWRHAHLKDGLQSAEKSIIGEFDLLVELSEHERRLLKYCDLMELAMYAMEELDTGNLSVAVVVRNCLSAIRKHGLTDVTPSALRLFDLMITKYEYRYNLDTGKDVTHGWPDYN